MRIRPAETGDAGGISDVLEQLVAAGLRSNASDKAFVLSHYIADPHRIACTVAEDGSGRILGLQSLKRATEDNPYGVEPGWGIIGTHVSPQAARRGIGSRLFAASREAAIAAGLRKIDATIGADNSLGLAYYEAMGFRTYRRTDSAICKCYELP
ncbi:GNAT family N-acetyltransferase [Boseongicola sp. H5]|uniref:GNAT family N-acetyltransferase n=1 Tax=Boseongicola sp. H5 TaxID=2763261 RepID=UPI001D0BA090|nr:GNAT family N-acetyltransferase [Boseongicola sp. H5]